MIDRRSRYKSTPVLIVADGHGGTQPLLDLRADAADQRRAADHARPTPTASTCWRGASTATRRGSGGSATPRAELDPFDVVEPGEPIADPAGQVAACPRRASTSLVDGSPLDADRAGAADARRGARERLRPVGAGAALQARAARRRRVRPARRRPVRARRRPSSFEVEPPGGLHPAALRGPGHPHPPALRDDRVELLPRGAGDGRGGAARRRGAGRGVAEHDGQRRRLRRCCRATRSPCEVRRHRRPVRRGPPAA